MNAVEMIGLVLFVIFVYVICDVNYFVRTYFTIWTGRLYQRYYSLNETTSIYSVCTTQDIGVNLLMRPSRMLRELDFVRFHFWERTGVYQRSITMRVGALQAATQLILIQPVHLFTFFRIDTKLVYWDDKSFLMEHSLLSLPSGRTCAIFTSRQHVIGAGADTTMLLGTAAPVRPSSCPDDVRRWLQVLEYTSAKLRKK